MRVAVEMKQEMVKGRSVIAMKREELLPHRAAEVIDRLREAHRLVLDEAEGEAANEHAAVVLVLALKDELR